MNATDEIKGEQRALRSSKSKPSNIASKEDIPKTSPKPETSSAEEPESPKKEFYSDKDGEGDLDVRVSKINRIVYFVVIKSLVEDVLAINLATMASAEVPNVSEIQDTYTYLPKVTTNELLKLDCFLPLLEPHVTEFMAKYSASEGFFASWKRATEIAGLRAQIFEIENTKKPKANDEIIAGLNLYVLEKLIFSEHKKIERQDQAKAAALHTAVEICDLPDTNFIPNAVGTPPERKRGRSSSVSPKKPSPKHSRFESSSKSPRRFVPKVAISKLNLPLFYMINHETMPSNNKIASVSIHFILLGK